MISNPFATDSTDPQRHESIMVYRGFFYLRAAALLCLAAVIAYIWHDPQPEPHGGSWLGYTLGAIGIAIIVFLMLLGLRKRSYKTSTKRLADWVSAHVYLGLSLIVITTLHAGFQFSWSVHGLAYLLLLAVVASGIFGIYAYMRYPQLITENRHGVTLKLMLSQIDELDREIRRLSLPMSESVAAALRDAVVNTRIGGSFLQQLRGRDPDCATLKARLLVSGRATGDDAADMVAMRQVLGLLARKEGLLARARRDVQLHALLRVWMFVHVPLSFALLAALVAHIFSVFYYW